MNGNFQVVLRVRPLTNKQHQQIQLYEKANLGKRNSHKSMKLSQSALAFYSKYHHFNIHDIIQVKGNQIHIADPQYKNMDKQTKVYEYSKIYSPEHKNMSIFADLQEAIRTVSQGYNCTIMAYGITGSGKTYSIFGNQKNNQEEGLSYLTCQYLSKIKHEKQNDGLKVSLSMSFIEIYNENVRDLLTTQCKYVNVVEDSQGNTNIQDLTEISINQPSQFAQLISTASARRIFASTQANQNSSRSHAILQLNVETLTTQGQATLSKLLIIDLAGSQKIHLGSSSKKNNEGANINKSLLALGNCINLLAQNKTEKLYIPYRDSKLTRILRDSLGGNTKTIMIACINPYPFSVDDTVTTLNYANRAQGIKKSIFKNTIQKQIELKQIGICQICKNKLELTVNSQKEQEKKSEIIEQLDKKINNTQIKNIKNLFEKIYEDVVDNARESQQIKNLGIDDDMEWEKLKQVNEYQGKILKQTFMALLMKALQPVGSEDKFGKQNAQNLNQNIGQQGQRLTNIENLQSSCSTRRRSRNKLEYMKRNSSRDLF